MAKKLFLVLILIGVLVIGVSLASAALCQNSKGYYEDCSSGSSSKSKYKTFNTADYEKPLFKGSYGNYRYEQYRKGDYNPNPWYKSRRTYSGYSGGGPYFFGGNYGYGGYRNYGGYGGYRGYGGYGYYAPYSYVGYGYGSGPFSWFWY